MRYTHSTTPERRASVHRHPAVKPKILVSPFYPFTSRREHVLRLDFYYNATLVDLLKKLIREHKTEAVNVSAGRLCAGGFLSRERCWFVEPCIWSAVKTELQRAGYQVEGIP